jgi:hypothetical protein
VALMQLKALKLHIVRKIPPGLPRQGAQGLLPALGILEQGIPEAFHGMRLDGVAPTQCLQAIYVVNRYHHTACIKEKAGNADLFCSEASQASI